MEIEKLIEQANRFGMELRRDGGEFEYSIGEKFLNYATALSTLQAENAQLRGELEYEREHANAYHEECGQWEAENEKLRETVDKYATAARVIALHLKPFCDESLPYDEMIADAARKASDELEQVKRENNALWTYIEIVDREYRRYMDRGYIDRLDELKKVWKRGQKEDRQWNG